MVFAKLKKAESKSNKTISKYTIVSQLSSINST